VKGSKYTRNCSICGAEFDIKMMRNGRPSTRKTCSRECSFKFRPTVRPWTKEETETLLDLVQSLPLRRLVKALNMRNRMRGRPDRTTNSIDKKIRSLGYSTRAEIVYYSFSKVARILKVPRNTVAGWKKLTVDPLETYQHNGKKFAFNYVTKKELLKFAQKRPECFGGVDQIGLGLLLEDADLAREILRQHPKRPKPAYASKRVRCVETGKIYASLGEAARDVYVARQGISKAIRNGHRANGYHFEQI
jgi:hypothetical protein